MLEKNIFLNPIFINNNNYELLFSIYDKNTILIQDEIDKNDKISLLIILNIVVIGFVLAAFLVLLIQLWHKKKNKL